MRRHRRERSCEPSGPAPGQRRRLGVTPSDSHAASGSYCRGSSLANAAGASIDGRPRAVYRRTPHLVEDTERDQPLPRCEQGHRPYRLRQNHYRKGGPGDDVGRPRWRIGVGFLAADDDHHAGDLYVGWMGLVPCVQKRASIRNADRAGEPNPNRRSNTRGTPRTGRNRAEGVPGATRRPSVGEPRAGRRSEQVVASRGPPRDGAEASGRGGGGSRRVRYWRRCARSPR